jgi:hypothetical protein
MNQKLGGRQIIWQYKNSALGQRLFVTSTARIHTMSVEFLEPGFNTVCIK